MKKSKGFGNPKLSKELEKSVKSIKNQLLTIFINITSKNETVPLFSTARKQALQIAVNQIAQERSDIYIRVGHDKEMGTFAFVMACQEGIENHDYLWLEQSKITNKWLLMAQCPGAFRYDCLNAYLNKEDAQAALIKVRPLIWSMPLEEWEAHLQSPVYREMLNQVPDGDDELIGIIKDGQRILFDEEQRKLVNQVAKQGISNQADVKENFAAIVDELFVD